MAFATVFGLITSIEPKPPAAGPAPGTAPTRTCSLRRVGYITLVVLVGVLNLLALALVLGFQQPAVPGVTGPYQTLGYADVNLPNEEQERPVMVRVIYPAMDHAEGEPLQYFSSRMAREFVLRPAKEFIGDWARYVSWLLSHWTLVTLPMLRSAPLRAPAEQGRGTSPLGFPVIVFSHGLLGTKELYSAVTMELASHGFIVLALQHMDGSSPIAVRPDGSVVYFKSLADTTRDDGEAAAVWARRQQVEWRVSEMLAAVRHIPELHKGFGDLPSSWGCINAEQVLIAGHSFGGATAIAFTARHGVAEGVLAMMVIDPAVDWAPDDGRLGLIAGDIVRHDGDKARFPMPWQTRRPPSSFTPFPFPLSPLPSLLQIHTPV